MFSASLPLRWLIAENSVSLKTSFLLTACILTLHPTDFPWPGLLLFTDCQPVAAEQPAQSGMTLKPGQHKLWLFCSADGLLLRAVSVSVEWWEILAWGGNFSFRNSVGSVLNYILALRVTKISTQFLIVFPKVLWILFTIMSPLLLSSYSRQQIPACDISSVFMSIFILNLRLVFLF